MSDFINNFWSTYVAAITLIGIFGCLLLLILVASKKVVPSSDNTTGHVWDEDLRELNNPLPRWWLFLFIFTLVFAVGYLVLYPGLGSWKGVLPGYEGGWTQVKQWQREMDKADMACAAACGQSGRETAVPSPRPRRR